MSIDDIRAEVCDLHRHLTRWGLVTWTSGNVSARVPGEDLLVIKPSGVEYDSLTPKSMVVCDLDGNLVEGEHSPSSDTAMADEFGGDIPLGPFALIGSDDIGRGIVETLRASRSPAVLMRQHGPFTIGPTAKAAVKAAVMCEDVARTLHLARQLGPVDRLPAHAVDSLFDRYQNVYGQPLMEGQQ